MLEAKWRFVFWLVSLCSLNLMSKFDWLVWSHDNRDSQDMLRLDPNSLELAWTAVKIDKIALNKEETNLNRSQYKTKALCVQMEFHKCS